MSAVRCEGSGTEHAFLISQNRLLGMDTKLIWLVIVLFFFAFYSASRFVHNRYALKSVCSAINSSVHRDGLKNNVNLSMALEECENMEAL